MPTGRPDGSIFVFLAATDRRGMRTKKATFEQVFPANHMVYPIPHRIEPNDTLVVGGSMHQGRIGVGKLTLFIAKGICVGIRHERIFIYREVRVSRIKSEDKDHNDVSSLHPKS